MLPFLNSVWCLNTPWNTDHGQRLGPACVVHLNNQGFDDHIFIVGLINITLAILELRLTYQNSTLVCMDVIFDHQSCNNVISVSSTFSFQRRIFCFDWGPRRHTQRHAHLTFMLTHCQRWHFPFCLSFLISSLFHSPGTVSANRRRPLITEGFISGSLSNEEWKWQLNLTSAMGSAWSPPHCWWRIQLGYHLGAHRMVLGG